MAIIIMIIIFCHSAQTADQSSNASSTFIETVLSVVVPSFEEMPQSEKNEIIESLQFVVRKGAHFSIYFALGFCLFGAFNTYSFKTKFKYLAALITCAIYATGDEIHQLFVPGRSGQITDVVLDTCGGALGSLLILIIIWALRKHYVKRERIL
jgi:VanZ family protein